jgi:ubiquinone/menaquinone biosynthesis C-methylase UbiE
MKSPWMRLKKNLEILRDDIYPQPMDIGHMRWTARAICMMKPHIGDVGNVLDVGCGVGYAEKWFRRIGITDYVGVSLGEDVSVAVNRGLWVYENDFHFLPWQDGDFDMIFSRHSLEHSPMPLLALMEWHRVSNKYLGLVLPNPEHWGWAGRNHYSVMNQTQIEFLLEVAGWVVVMKNVEIPEEFIYLCKKKSEEKIEN